MNKTAIAIISFTAGAAVGVGGTWKMFEAKYKRIADEEIASVKEVFSRKSTNEKQDDTVISEKPTFNMCNEKTLNITKPHEKMADYIQMVSPYSNDIVEEGGPTLMDKPYVISPDVFGEISDYETISLTYYADEVLTDEADEIIENPSELIGPDALTHFGEYEDDSVFVRNDEHKIDYEILLDTRKYSDVFGVNTKNEQE